MAGRQGLRFRRAGTHRAETIVKCVTKPCVLEVGSAGHFPKKGSPYWLHGELRRDSPHPVGIDITAESVSYLLAADLDPDTSDFQHTEGTTF